MNKKVVISVFVLALLVSLAAGIHDTTADIVGDNGLRYASGPYIRFPSNTTYSIKVLSLDVKFFAKIFGNVNYSMCYSLDKRCNDTLPLTIHYFGLGFLNNDDYITGSLTLPELSDGSHTITVYLTCDTDTWDINSPNYPDPDHYTYVDSQTVSFTIDTNSEQEIPEFPSWAILSLFLIATLSVTVIRKRLSLQVPQNAR